MGVIHQRRTDFTAINTIVTDLNKPFGQDMHAEPPEELHTGERGKLIDGVIAVVFHLESYLFVVQMNDALITDRHAMNILSKVFNELIRFTQGGFAEDHPWFIPGGFNICFILIKQFFSAELSGDHFHQLAFEYGAEHFNRIEIFAVFSDMDQLTGKFLTESRHDAVHMRVKAEVLPPRCVVCK